MIPDPPKPAGHELSLGRFPQGGHTLCDVAELYVDREDPKIIRQCLCRTAQMLDREAQQVEDTDEQLVVRTWHLDGPLQHRCRDLVLLLFDEALTEGFV